MNASRLIWVTATGEDRAIHFRCERCGDSALIATPVTAAALAKAAEPFVELHSGCKPAEATA